MHRPCIGYCPSFCGAPLLLAKGKCLMGQPSWAGYLTIHDKLRSSLIAPSQDRNEGWSMSTLVCKDEKHLQQLSKHPVDDRLSPHTATLLMWDIQRPSEAPLSSKRNDQAICCPKSDRIQTECTKFAHHCIADTLRLRPYVIDTDLYYHKVESCDIDCITELAPRLWALPHLSEYLTRLSSAQEYVMIF